jgi:hypothetical protein
MPFELGSANHSAHGRCRDEYKMPADSPVSAAD